MPLQTDQIQTKQLETDFDAIGIQELRFSLIGNSELKLQLRQSLQFLRWLQDQLQTSASRFCGCAEIREIDIVGMHDLVVVLWLVSLVEGKSDVNGNVHALGDCVGILARVVDFTLGSGSGAFDKYLTSLESLLARALKDCITYLLNIMLSFQNYLGQLTKYVSAAQLWSFLSRLVGRLERYGNSGCESCMIASLKLVPLLLEQNNAVSEILEPDLVETMLFSVFNRLKIKLEHSCSEKFSALFQTCQAASPEVNLLGSSTKFMLGGNLDLNSITALLVAAAQILNFLENSLDHGINLLSRAYNYKSLLFFDSLLALYGPTNTELLNIALLNVSRIYLSCLAKEKLSDELTITQNFEYLFPRINWILKNNASSNVHLPKYVRRPISVLSDLCLSYPEACLRIKNSNTDIRVLTDLKKLFSSLKGFKYLHNLKIQSEHEKKIVDLVGAQTLISAAYQVSEDTQMEDISSCILLLSVYTSSNEECRRRVTDFGAKVAGSSAPNFLCLLVCEVVENFEFLTLQLFLNVAFFRELQSMPDNEDSLQKWNWFSQNLSCLMYLIQHPIYTNTFYLLRTLSRSVSTVKTFFVDCNSIKSTYEFFSTPTPLNLSEKPNASFYNTIAQKYDASSRLDSCETFLSCLMSFISHHKSLGYALSLFSMADGGSDALWDRIRKELYNLTTGIFGCLANLCLDFGPYRKAILESEKFLKDLSRLFNRSLRDNSVHTMAGTQNLAEASLQEISYERIQAQIGVFQIIHNLLYNETETNRKLVWEHIPLSIVFEKSLYGISVPRNQDLELHKLLLKLKLISFGIMRNLTLNSTEFSNSISYHYKQYVLLQDNAHLHIPANWGEYLLESLLAFDLYLDINWSYNIEMALTRDDSFYLQLLNVPEYNDLFVAITYLEDNRHINITDFKASDFPSNELLSFWKRILQVRMLPEFELAVDAGEKCNFSVKLVDAKLAIVWNLINLLFEEGNRRMHRWPATDGRGGSNSEPQTTHDSAAAEMTPRDKAQRLLEFGFRELLADLIYQMSIPYKKYLNTGKFGLLRRFDNINSNDLLDKLKTAYRQIMACGNGILLEQVNMDFNGSHLSETLNDEPSLDAIVEGAGASGSTACEQPFEDTRSADYEDESDEDIAEPWIS